MAAANSSGGVMGKVIDAQSFVVAGAATQQVGREEEIFRLNGSQPPGAPKASHRAQGRRNRTMPQKRPCPKSRGVGESHARKALPALHLRTQLVQKSPRIRQFIQPQTPRRLQ